MKTGSAHGEKRAVRLFAYFSRFGVINAYAYGEELKRKAHEEAKARHNRLPTYAEQRSIKTLTDALRDFAPVIMKIFAKRTTSYSVAETEIILGELREKRNYQSREVFLSSAVFVADFAEALAIFLHEHSHIFGYDGSRGFTDALTELMETLVRERKNLDAYEVKWNEARKRVEQERANEKNEEKITDLEADLELMDEQQLRDFVPLQPECPFFGVELRYFS